MSTDRLPLGDWITALVGAVRVAEPAAHARLATVVGNRRAHITLDEDSVVVAMSDGTVTILPSDTEPVDGRGSTSRGVVLAILDGHLEASDAVRDGAIDVRGDIESLGRIFHAIEIILDVSTRTPALRELARRYRAEDPSARFDPPPSTDPAGETALLDRLGLLNEEE